MFFLNRKDNSLPDDVTTTKTNKHIFTPLFDTNICWNEMYRVIECECTTVKFYPPPKFHLLFTATDHISPALNPISNNMLLGGKYAAGRAGMEIAKRSFIVIAARRVYLMHDL